MGLSIIIGLRATGQRSLVYDVEGRTLGPVFFLRCRGQDPGSGFLRLCLSSKDGVPSIEGIAAMRAELNKAAAGKDVVIDGWEAAIQQ